MPDILSYCVFHCFRGTSPFCITANFLQGEMVIWSHFSFFCLSFFSLLPRFKCAVCVYTMLLYCYYWSQHHQSDHNTLPLLYWTQFQPCWFVEMWMIKASDTSIPLFLRSSPVLGGSRRQSLLSCVYIWSSFYGCVCVCESCLRPFLIFHSPSPSLSQAPLPWLSVGV